MLVLWMMLVGVVVVDSVFLLVQVVMFGVVDFVLLVLLLGIFLEMELVVIGVFVVLFFLVILIFVCVVLLLFLCSGVFGVVFDVVCMGFLMVYLCQKENIQLVIVEIGDLVFDMQCVYDDVFVKFDIVVGLFLCSVVIVVVQSGCVSKFMVVLVQFDMNGEIELQLLLQMLVVGLFIDEEVCQVVNWVEKEKVFGKIFVICIGIVWQKCVVCFFQLCVCQLGLQVEMLELSMFFNVFFVFGLV